MTRLSYGALGRIKLGYTTKTNRVSPVKPFINDLINLIMILANELLETAQTCKAKNFELQWIYMLKWLALAYPPKAICVGREKSTELFMHRDTSLSTSVTRHEKRRN